MLKFNVADLALEWFVGGVCAEFLGVSDLGGFLSEFTATPATRIGLLT